MVTHTEENIQQQDINHLSQHLLKIAKGAALLVGDMLVEASAEATVGKLAIENKANFHDLVTKYDRQSEQMITDYIFQQHSDSTIVGEEGGAKGSGSIHWYVDPIDGTSNFARGIPFFCVSIGAALGDQMLAGVIYDPVRREMFSASTQGAFLDDKPIRAHGSQTDSGALILTAFPSPHATGVSDDDFKLFSELVRSFATVRRVGSCALSLAYIACGRADVVFESSVNPWDVAAGILIVEQAGGRYLPLASPSSPADQQPWLSPKFIATCPEFDLEQSVLRGLPFMI